MRARGISMYGKEIEEFERSIPLKFEYLGGVRSGFWVTELGWDVLRVAQIDEEDPRQPYGLAMLLTNNEKEDIVPSSATAVLHVEHRLPVDGLLLARGWHGLEGGRSEQFRWMGERSEIALTHLQPGACSIEMDVEPALRPESPPFVLKVNIGDISIDYSLLGRKRIGINFQSNGQVVQVLGLEARGGLSKPPPGDHRLLKARVFGFNLSGKCVSK